MRKLVFLYALIFLALCGAWQCFAQSQRALMGVGKGAVVVSGYTGPANIVASPKMWWGWRGVSSSFSGNVAKICDQGTGLTCANVTWAAGVLSVPTILGSACNNSTNICIVNTLYDQSGALNCGGAACDLTSAGVLPVMTVNCMGTKPCMACTSSTDLHSTTNSGAIAQPLTVSFAAERTGNVTSFSDAVGSDVGGANQSGFSNSANTALQFAGTVVSVTGVADNSYHAAQMVYNAASSVAYIDGTSNATSPGSGGFPGSASVAVCGLTTGAGNNLTGNFLEAGVWGTGFTSGNQSSMNSNQHSYWGF